MKARFSRVRGEKGKWSGGVKRTFAAANYMMFRPMEGESEEKFRTAFNGAHSEMVPQDVHNYLGKGMNEQQFAYRVILSPGANMGEETIKDWAKKVMAEAGYDRYVAVAHAGEKGHTSNPHVHVIILTNNKLEREDFYKLRMIGDRFTESAMLQKDRDLHMAPRRWLEEQMKAQLKSQEDAVRGSMSQNRELKKGVGSTGQEDQDEKARREEEQNKRKKMSMDFDM
ncbi:hypothetical protein DC3_55490 [Deinococcus cellulosilyticus NBRC 106333 = KACC 11606]|uniref:Uncharacterized protein n=1 Tax=Deinococcus cellulosilyticus (strain DSM 18568 / NBRC 106333 / KACC 11606 / 5516J-15) TaxID=1223518 RepID=A0A511NAR1_DEIC1|nr:hypothetical protein DC3_55490 [Deinococcus cellulosilyticus NBRC 106333 = KACC 11606]